MLKKVKAVKLLILGLALVMLASVFVSAKAPTTVDFWTISLRPTFDGFFNDLIAKYEKAHPDVKVQWTDLPYDAIQSKLIAAVAGGTSPDVVNLNTEMALVLSGKNALVNLDKEATAAQRSPYIKTLYNSTKTSKGAFAFPWYGAPDVMIYNKDLFAKAGITDIPKTFDEALAFGKTMHEKTGAYPFIPDFFYRIMFFEGIPFLNVGKTKAAFNTPAAVAVLKKYKKATDENAVPRTDWGQWDKMLQEFNTGKLAMINSGPQSIKRIKDEAPDIYKNIEVTSSMLGKAGLILNPIMNLVVPVASKHHKEAIAFAAYITNDQNQLAFSKTVAIFPSTINASQDPFFKSDVSKPETKATAIAAEELIHTADLTLAIPQQLDIFTAVNKAAEAVILGNEDPKAALTAAEKKVNSILAGK